jgi:FMN phosphatase YigB (HAD superfamily)
LFGNFRIIAREIRLIFRIVAINNIIFDLGNVLLDIDLSRIQTGFRALYGKAYDDVYRQLTDNKVFELYETGGMTTEEFVSTLGVLAQPPIPPEQIIEVWNSIFIGFPKQHVDLLKALRARQQVFLLSNINDLHARWIDAYMLRVFGEPDYRSVYFDGAYYSHLIRLRKPNPEVFEYVLSDADIRPQETLFIDDIFENVEGSRAVGIHGLYKTPEVSLESLVQRYV